MRALLSTSAQLPTPANLVTMLSLDYFAKHCFDLGIELKRVEVIPDEEEDIIEAARRLAKKYDWVISTGGIGTPKRF